MDKLVERETATRNPLVAAPALAVQFFLIPLAVVGITVLRVCRLPSLLDRRPRGRRTIWPRFRTAARTAVAGRLRAVAADGRSEGARATSRSRRRWSRRSSSAKDDDPRVRRYLALAIGRLDPPLPRKRSTCSASRSTTRTSRGRRRLVTHQRLDRRDERGAHQHDLGAGRVGRSARSCRDCSRCTRRRTPASARWWSMRSARCRATRRSTTLRTALRGQSARRALERGGRARAPRRPRRCAGAAADARPRVRRADREAEVRQDEDQDPVADVMISGLRAAAALKDDVAAARRSRPEPAGSQHESAAGGARSAEGDGIGGDGGGVHG